MVRLAPNTPDYNRWNKADKQRMQELIEIIGKSVADWNSRRPLSPVTCPPKHPYQPPARSSFGIKVLPAAQEIVDRGVYLVGKFDWFQSPMAG